MPQVVIWPLRAYKGNQVQAIQTGAPTQKTTNFLQPVLMLQRPRRIGGRVALDVPVNRPWNVTRSNMIDVPSESFVNQPSVVHPLLPQPPTYFRITGITKDSTGAVLGTCTVDWFRTSDDAKLDSTTSDASGFYEFRTAGQPPNAYYLVAYKAGSPDVAGTTVSTLTGV